jgi:hypothetical protein
MYVCVCVCVCVTPDLDVCMSNPHTHTHTYHKVMRQMVMISVLQVLLLCYSSLSKVWTKLILNLTESGRKEKGLMHKLRTAKSYDDWKRIAGELDALRGHDLWRRTDSSTLYDHHTLQKRIKFTR